MLDGLAEPVGEVDVRHAAIVGTGPEAPRQKRRGDLCRKDPRHVVALSREVVTGRAERDDPELRPGTAHEAGDDEQLVRVARRRTTARQFRRPRGQPRRARPGARPRPPRPSGTVRTLATRPPATRKARRKPGSRAGATMQSLALRRRSSSARCATTSSSAPSRSRIRAASSKRRSRESRASFSRARGSAIRRVVDLEPVERPRRELGAPLAAERPERPRLRHDPPALVPPLEIDVPLRPGRARVRRRAQLPEKPELLERGLELRPEHAPLDAVERPEGRLDRRSLPSAREVRAQARAQIAGLADVEHRPLAVVEEVDARRGRRARDERALRAELPRPRRCERHEVADRARRRAPGRAP